MKEPVYKEALIKGVFSPEQAKQVISTLFGSKIQMHSDSAFSNWVKKGSSSAEDSTRRKELSESLQRLVKALETINETSGEEVLLDCELKMRFVKQDKSTAGPS